MANGAGRSTEVKTMELTVIRTLPATPSEVFDAWLDWKNPGSPWFGAARAIVHPEVDGLFFHMVNFEDHDWAHYGRFVTLDRPRRIQHTWVSEATRGLESVVTLTLDRQKDQTRVRLHHANLPDDAMGRRHEEGWGFVLGALAERLTQNGQP
jgi:uncharacterized protein YndB with AHSA1/START domain